MLSQGQLNEVILLIMGFLIVRDVIVQSLIIWLWKKWQPWKEDTKEPEKQPEPIYHPNGIPVGMLPGDEVPPQNLAAISDYVEQQANRARQQHYEQEGQQGG